jgi:sterol desaturase/sphingolipid hydroxylase (fatty acid hydroxylase superfamily)
MAGDESSGRARGVEGPLSRRSDRGGNAVKKILFSYMQPVMVVAVVLFWAFGPVTWIKNPWALTVATSVTTLLVLGLEWLNERHASWRLTKKEFFTDLFYVILGSTAISWLTDNLADGSLKAAKHSFGIATPWAMHLPFVAQVGLVIFLIEFGQYWMHRLMHNYTPFWLTHAPHHHITQLNAMKGAVGNPLELFLISLSVVALFDLPEAAEFCALTILTVVSTFAHANTRCDPPQWYAFFFTTIQHHSLHHSVPYEDTRCNYANSMILIDRVFGTYRDGESEIVGQDKRRRLSIPEQFMFPFEPLIAKIKNKRGRAEVAVGGGEDVGFDAVVASSPAAA